MSGKEENMSGPSGNSWEDDGFNWQDYLDATNSVEVPHVLFSHVEQSLETGLEEGMMLEVPNTSPANSHWIAIITMACGPLLRLRYIGQEDSRANDFWCDLAKVKVHPLGWCKSQSLELIPPDDLKEKLSDYKSLIEDAFKSGKSVPLSLLGNDGFTPVERIKQGMKLEVQDKVDPNHLWFATIVENVGGRLLLRHDSPDSASPDFWLFYNSCRLFRFGWTSQQGLPYVLKWPSHIKNHRHEEWETVIVKAQEEAKRIPIPPDLFQNSFPDIVHQFKIGMKLEAIHPHNMAQIYPATVVKICNSHYFLVKIDTHDTSESEGLETTWLCTADHPYIFPIGWAHNHCLQLTHPSGWTTFRGDFDWQEYLDMTNSNGAPISCFPKRSSAVELGFEVGMKLEAVDPKNPHHICAASIERIVDNLLWIHLESHERVHRFHPSHIVSMDSTDIFPIGWCESNSYPLKPPLQFQAHVKAPPKEENPKKEDSVSLPCPQPRSFWCPKIYFNHKCFSGPFLSKGKLAQLPKAVGPGPVTLVLKEVLGMLISVAYKSSRVLKELQVDGDLESGMHMEFVKAKYKNCTYRASVAVVKSAEEVPAFCKDICSRLQVCPFMFGPIAVGENNCPENCNTLSKTRFTQYWAHGKRKVGRPKGETSTITRPKKKRGRKKRLEGSTENNNNYDDDDDATCEMKPLESKINDDDATCETKPLESTINNDDDDVTCKTKPPESKVNNNDDDATCETKALESTVNNKSIDDDDATFETKALESKVNDDDTCEAKPPESKINDDDATCETKPYECKVNDDDNGDDDTCETKPLEIEDEPALEAEINVDANGNETSVSLNETTHVKRPYKKKEFPRSEIKTRGAKLPNFALQMKVGYWPNREIFVSSSHSSAKRAKYDKYEALSSSESCGSQNSGDSHEVKPEPMDTSSVTDDQFQAKSLPADIMELESNPLHWTVENVYQFLNKTDDCAFIAEAFKEELIDGQAFMMLNFPTVKGHFHLKTAAALKVCAHVRRVKLAYYFHYVADSEP